MQTLSENLMVLAGIVAAITLFLAVWDWATTSRNWQILYIPENALVAKSAVNCLFAVWMIIIGLSVFRIIPTDLVISVSGVVLILWCLITIFYRVRNLLARMRTPK